MYGFKIFNKVLVQRLTWIAGRIIGVSQLAFVKGRFILYNTVILHDVMHEDRRKKEKG